MVDETKAAAQAVALKAKNPSWGYLKIAQEIGWEKHKVRRALNMAERGQVKAGVMTRPISEIKVGKRHRTDFGDINGLAKSIEEVGLLHAIVIQPDGRLIAGGRRLRALKQLGWTDIPVRVVDLDKIVRGEYAENTQRKDFTYAEAVAIMREVKPLEVKAAKERQLAGAKRGAKEGGRGKKKTFAANDRKGKRADTAADRTAKGTGKKRRTLEKAAAVIEAAEKNPLLADLAERLADENVKVDAVHREMKQRQAREAYEARAEEGGDVGDLVAMAQAGRRFKVIYADPAWQFKTWSDRGKERSAERHYDTMDLEEIKALPIGPLADDDCALFLWGTWPHLQSVLDVIKAWGFEYSGVAFVWVKTTAKVGGEEKLHWGMGYCTRANTEFCLFATKGSPLRLTQDVHEVIQAPVAEHSVKPEEARTRIESLFVGPYLELFARRAVPDWTVWGDEVKPEAVAIEIPAAPAAA